MRLVVAVIWDLNSCVLQQKQYSVNNLTSTEPEEVQWKAWSITYSPLLERVFNTPNETFEKVLSKQLKRAQVKGTATIQAGSICIYDS